MSNHTLKIQAFQVAESFNIRKLRTEFTAEVFAGNNSELFYYFADNQRYIYVLNYGIIVFCNYDEVAKSEFLRFVKSYSEHPLEQDIFEDYSIVLDDHAEK